MDKEGHLGSLPSFCPEPPWCHPGVGDGSLSHHPLSPGHTKVLGGTFFMQKGSKIGLAAVPHGPMSLSPLLCPFCSPPRGFGDIISSLTQGHRLKAVPCFWGQTALCWGTEHGPEFSSAIASQLGLHSAAPGRLNVAVAITFPEDSGDVFLLPSEKHLAARRHLVLGDETLQLKTFWHVQHMLSTLLQHRWHLGGFVPPARDTQASGKEKGTPVEDSGLSVTP